MAVLNNDIFHISDNVIINDPNLAGLLYIEYFTGMKHSPQSGIISNYHLSLITYKSAGHIIPSNSESKQKRVINIQFPRGLCDDGLINKKQFESIRQMLKKADRGIIFSMEALLKVHNLIKKIVGQPNDFYAVINFITLLYELSLFTAEAPLALDHHPASANETYSGSRRVRKVQEYINNNYKKNIRLQSLSEIAGMTPVAFSRFFRTHAGETISDYIIKVRIKHAAELLVDSAMPISEICYLSGFNNVSNFNRIFKKSKNCTPKEYRQNNMKASAESF